MKLISGLRTMSKFREELGELANARMEDLIQRDMLATTTVMYPGAAAAMSDIGASIAVDGTADANWVVSYDIIRKAVRKLVRNRAKKNTMIVTGSTKIGTAPIAKAYYAIIGADVKSDLESLTRGASYEKEFVFIPAHKYAGAASLAEGEVGGMHEVRFIEAESAVVYRNVGATVPSNYVGDLQFTADAASLTIYNPTASPVSITGIVATDPYGTSIAAGGKVTTTLEAHAAALDAVTGLVRSLGKFDAFPILFPTEGSFGTVGLKGLEKIKFNSKSPAQVENLNPYGTTGFFSYNFFYAGIILKPETLLKVLVAAKN